MYRQKVRLCRFAQIQPSSVWRKPRQPVQIWKLYIYMIAITTYGKYKRKITYFQPLGRVFAYKVANT